MASCQRGAQVKGEDSIFLSPLPRESWKPVPTGKRNSRMSNKMASATEPLKGEWHNQRRSLGAPRMPGRLPGCSPGTGLALAQLRPHRNASPPPPSPPGTARHWPGRRSSWKAKAIQNKTSHSSCCLCRAVGSWPSHKRGGSKELSLTGKQKAGADGETLRPGPLANRGARPVLE